MVKLLLHDLVVMSSSHKNNLLQCKVRLCIFLGPRIGNSFVYRVALAVVTQFLK